MSAHSGDIVMTDTHIVAEPAYVADPVDTALFNEISWGAVFAGVFMALAVQFLINLLGIGIGAAVLDPLTNDNPEASTFSIGSGIWFVFSGIIASFVGGYVASRLSGRPSKSTGSYHGLTTWAVTTIVVLYMLTTSVGALVGGAFSGLGSVIGTVGQTAATAATTVAPAIANATDSDPLAGIEQQIRSASGSDPQALRDAAVAAVRAAVTGDQATANDAKARAADAIAKAQGIPVEQARQQVDQYAKTYQDSMAAAKQQALEAADAATTAVSMGALLGFAALLLGAVAAWFGGAAGTKAVPVTEVGVNPRVV
jgi:hypothetical protein